jgi:Fic family protein
MPDYNKHTKTLQEELLDDFHTRTRNGLYALVQKTMAYNSNRIEGSTLTYEQTATLFDTRQLYGDGDTVYRAKDIEEMNGHFLMFNHALKTLEEPLSEELIKWFHFELKVGVFEDRANGYPIGLYKNKPNMVGTVTAMLPAYVGKQMGELLREYNAIENPNLQDLLEFHCKYETIHPFQDGNGRTGRMVLFRECLRNDVFPVLITDDTKARYYKSLTDMREGNPETFLMYAKDQQEELFSMVEPFLMAREASCHCNQKFGIVQTGTEEVSSEELKDALFTGKLVLDTIEDLLGKVRNLDEDGEPVEDTFDDMYGQITDDEREEFCRLYHIKSLSQGIDVGD